MTITRKNTSIVVQQQRRLERFEIVLDNSEEVYFAGQEITGKVVIECSEPKQVNEVLFEVKGRARTFWTKSRKNCSSNEAYFCEQFNTTYTHKLPKNDTSPEARKASREDGTKLLGRTMPAGVHEIPFSYTLPKHLPTSFEGEFGFVRYTCRAICERPWDVDIVCFRAFTVIGIEDLNQEADLLSLPLETRSTHPIALVCMKLGAVNTELRVAKGGYTPGEEIKVTARVQNNSRRTLRGLSIRLCQNVVYRSKTFAGAVETRATNMVVQSVEAEHKIHPGCDFFWKDKPVPVPSVPPRLLTKCKLIDVSYCLELFCTSPSFTVSLPVVIGTIPLLPGILGKMGNGTTVVERIGAKGGQPAKDVAKERAVQVTVTDETGKTVNGGGGGKEGEEEEEEDRMDPETEKACSAKKRVRMPSSVLSELYPALPSPYYKELYSGPVTISDDKERKFQFGQCLYAPKYPFYE